MRKPILVLGTVWIAAAAITGTTPQAAKLPQQQAAVSQSPIHRSVLDRYCVTCHNQKLKTAGLMLDTLDVANVERDAAIWEKVVRKLRSGAMPPPGMPRPNEESVGSLVSYLEIELDRVAAVRPNPGAPAIHRLNRAEYVNAVRDLLAFDIDGRLLLPADDSGYGFDNIADVLTVSPSLLERYLAAAHQISTLAIGRETVIGSSQRYAVPGLLVQDDRVSEETPFGSRGGTAVRHWFPLDGTYLIRVRLRRSAYDVIQGLTQQHEITMLVDGRPMKQFAIGGPELAGSELDARCQPALPTPECIYKRTADADLQVRLQIDAGPHTVAVTFPKVTSYDEDVRRPPVPLTSFRHAELDGIDPGVSSVQIDGPFDSKGPGDTPSRRAIFVCRPSRAEDEPACARKILANLARRAYRRPATDRDVGILLRFYDDGRREGGFEAGLELALERLLVSPEFLFRLEREPAAGASPGSAYRVSDLELASRLSFFLWSSLPDEQLLDLASRGRLKDPVVLEQQVRRLLADSRSQALVTNFAGQWLWLRNLRSVTPSPTEFPYWDDSLREGLQRETELLFESMLRDDRPVPDLLDAPYTFLNERLARHYQVPNIYGSHFRRVPITDDRRRGLFGQGSILTVTSYANRTSPVKRGAWLLENILGAPPPAPPPNVPSLDEDQGRHGRILTMRQRMDEHRANPVCASCHARMDPLGFAMENFDAIGQWRTTEGGLPIDVSGAFPDGTKFNGVIELRNVLLKRRTEFVDAVTERLLTYALGRGIEYYDRPAIRRIVRDASEHDYRWSSVILGIVNSTPFQMRKSAGLPSADGPGQ